MEAKDRLIFAMDIDKEKAIPLLSQLRGKVGMVKVKSLAAEWPGVIDEMQNRGFRVWRDWKHHDIPGTVANFIKADVKIAVDVCTVHTLGGSAMMKAADKIVAEIQEGLEEIDWRIEERELALKLFDAGAIKFGAFKLKLHEKQPDAPLSPIYIDLRLTRSVPALLRYIAIALYQKIKTDKISFDKIADIPTAATPIVTTLANSSMLSMISPKISKTHGLSGEIDGLYEPGQKVLLVDDLVTTADSKIEVAEIFENNRLIVKDVLVLVDREQGGEDALLRAGYKLHSVFKITDMLKLYLDEDKIGKEKYDETMAYLANG